MGLFQGRRPRPLTVAPLGEARGSLRFKVWALGAAILVLFGILSIQLLRLQIFRHEEFESRASSNRLRSIDTTPVRGLIYARDGSLVAENVPGFALTVIPADVPTDRAHAIAETLVPLVHLPVFEIESRILEGQRSIDPFQPVVLDANIADDLAFEIGTRRAALPGVAVESVFNRRYPQGTLLAQILGYVGPLTEGEFVDLQADRYRLSDRIGQTGVEATYESVLRGVPGRRQAEVNSSGREIRTLSDEAPTPGQGVVLTIDLPLQAEVQRLLQESMHGSIYAAAAVVDVHTGEILALVSFPTYDDNMFSGEIDEAALQAVYSDEARPLVNHAIADQFPPGSIFKVITGPAALQEGVITADTVIQSRGVIEVQNEVDPRITYRFRDTTSGNFNFVKGMAESSNVYFYYLAGGSPYRRPVAEELLTPEQKAAQDRLVRAGIIGGDQDFEGLGVERLAKWARAFGLDEPTGIDLPGEASGFVPDAEWKRRAFSEGWGQGDSYNFGIGQGFVVATPLQMLMAVAAIANGGDLLQPHVVRQVLDRDGNVVETARPVIRRHVGIDPENLALVRQGMARAVLAGTGGNAYFPEMQIAGKTGTAEFGEEPTFRDLFPTHGWFIGFAPYDDPQVAVVVFHQLGAGFLTATAGGQILKAWATLNGAIDPDRPAPPQRSSLEEDGLGGGAP